MARHLQNIDSFERLFERYQRHLDHKAKGNKSSFEKFGKDPKGSSVPNLLGRKYVPKKIYRPTVGRHSKKRETEFQELRNKPVTNLPATKSTRNKNYRRIPHRHTEKLDIIEKEETLNPLASEYVPLLSSKKTLKGPQYRERAKVPRSARCLSEMKKNEQNRESKDVSLVEDLTENKLNVDPKTLGFVLTGNELDPTSIGFVSDLTESELNRLVNREFEQFNFISSSLNILYAVFAGLHKQ